HFLGEPEGDLALAQLAVYLAASPKSDAVYAAMNRLKEDVEKTSAEPVPLHLRNAVTPLMSHFGYAQGYEHAHQFDDAVVGMECLPESLRDKKYYLPTDRG